MSQRQSFIVEVLSEKGNVEMVKLNKTQRTCIKESFVLISDRMDKFALKFYERLFEVAPELRALFKQDIKQQAGNLVHMLGIVIASIDHLDRITPQIQGLGQRHVRYGVKNEHYALVGEVLLWTLELHLGRAFTPEVKASWEYVYTLLVEIMMMPEPV